MNGRCTGNVYEWCDYFERQLKQLDCTPLGMTCRADPVETNEDDQNGCITETCTEDDEKCDGALKYQCIQGALVASDCRKWRGSDGTCAFEDGSSRCTASLSCDTPRVFSCNGDVLETCDLDSVFYIRDCARYVSTGTCVKHADVEVECGGVSVSQ